MTCNSGSSTHTGTSAPSSGAWQSSAVMEVARLDQLVRLYYSHALAPATARTYTSAQNRYLDFCASIPLPVNEYCLCLFVVFLASKRVTHVSISLSVTISAFFRIEFWPAWLSPRMRLSSPDHSPLIARTRVLAICSFCRFSSYNTASGRFYQPGETFMTHLTYSGLCCFFFKY